MKNKTAIRFYKELEEKDKYKLVNGLFIVKYISEEESVYIGEFLKSGRALNDTNTNMVRIIGTNQRFNKKRNMYTKASGYWAKLNIKFEESPIEDILYNVKGGLKK